jgi:hypothetical protein
VRTGRLDSQLCQVSRSGFAADTNQHHQSDHQCGDEAGQQSSLGLAAKRFGGKNGAVSVGIRRIDIVAYNFDLKEKHSFAGGHRHRYTVAHDDIHLLLPSEHEIVLEIGGVKQAGPPRRKHDKRR